jgi:hypothetical protein
MGNNCQIRNIRHKSLSDFLVLVMKRLIKFQIYLIIIILTFIFTTKIIIEFTNEDDIRNECGGVKIESFSSIYYTIIISLSAFLTYLSFIICASSIKIKFN